MTSELVPSLSNAVRTIAGALLLAERSAGLQLVSSVGTQKPLSNRDCRKLGDLGAMLEAVS